MAQCRRPFFIKDGNKKDVLVPCGKCQICKARRISNWSFRIKEELKQSLSAHFITLTYDDESQPITKNGYRTLRKSDLQKFLKRLRRAHTKRVNKWNTKASIKYVACGEYGGKIGRPHYHLLLFNADRDKIQKAWSRYKWVRSVIQRKRIGSDGRYHKVRHRKTWYHMGHVHYGNKKGVCGASIGYCLKYIFKPKDNNRDKRDDSKPEFVCFSQGIGVSYCTPAMIRYHRADLNNRMYVNLEGNKKASMPRYYKDRIYTKEEREQIASFSRNKFAEDILKDLFKIYQEDPHNGYQKQKREKEQATLALERKQQSLNRKFKNYVSV